MSITPRGMSVTEAYRIYRNDGFIVNRKYQRKLVWSEAQKIKLIDSILNSFPIPLILLAEHRENNKESIYEIIDGMQRLNAIFTFIENSYPIDGKFFDYKESARAKEAAESNVFSPSDGPMLGVHECANILDYQLAVTVFPAYQDEKITEIFGRINSQGKQLSTHDKRQAGVLSKFANIVRKLSSELRTDSSSEIVNLADMPEISIDSPTSRQNYGIKAEDVFWCKQGILRTSQLKDSEDEQFVADMLASVILGEPFPASKEEFDKAYDKDSDLSKKIEQKLMLYGEDKICEEIKTTFSILIDVIESVSSASNFLKKTVKRKSDGNPIKTPFYAIFFAFFELVVKESKRPEYPRKIIDSLTNLNDKLTRGKHYTTTKERVHELTPLSQADG